jgi:hypothetical protein
VLQGRWRPHRQPSRAARPARQDCSRGGYVRAALATAMGHESEQTTTDHYAGRGAVANASIGRVVDLLQ